MLGALYTSERRLEDARGEFERIVATPKAAKTWTSRFSSRRRPKNSWRRTRASTTRSPGEPTFLYHLGTVYFGMGEVANAQQALQEALKLKADFPGADEARKTLAQIGG